MTIELFTIGHSNHSLDVFLNLLQQHGIEALGDIRRFPSSRTFPQFNRESLSAALQEQGREYHWLEALGGRRSKSKGDSSSPNTGLRNQSFRNYADYMLTEEFQQGIEELRKIAEVKRTAIMCAESVYWRCHRRLVSDYAVANGWSVQHVFPTGEVRSHTLTEGAKPAAGTVTYPGQKTLFD